MLKNHPKLYTKPPNSGEWNRQRGLASLETWPRYWQKDRVKRRQNWLHVYPTLIRWMVFELFFNCVTVQHKNCVSKQRNGGPTRHIVYQTPSCQNNPAGVELFLFLRKVYFRSTKFACVLARWVRRTWWEKSLPFRGFLYGRKKGKLINGVHPHCSITWNSSLENFPVLIQF